jgi:nucleotide-binding universal stress UspA family protein
MFDRILFPTDGSDGAAAARDAVFDVAERHGAAVDVLHVADTTVLSSTRVETEVHDEFVRQGERIVETVADAAASRGIPTRTDVLQGGVPETIADYADANGIDLIVMPTHGRTGVERVVLGSVTERVLRTAAVPVLTLNPEATPYRYPFESVLVPIDGSGPADRALELGVDVATAYGAAIDLLSVVDVASLGIDVHSEVQTDVLAERAESVVDDARDYADANGASAVQTTVEFGTAVHRAISAYIDEHDVDLVVLGTHGRSGLDRLLLGSVTERVVRTATVPVLTAPPA